jgi:hypothetical protein
MYASSHDLEENDEDMYTPPKSVISLAISTSTLGMAWYNELRNEILVDILLLTTDDVENMLTALKVKARPTMFLLHPKIVANKQLLELICSKPIEITFESTSHQQYGDNQPLQYFVPKSSTYQVDAAMDLICNHLIVRSLIRDTSIGKSKSYYENYHKIASKIPIDNSLIQQALGSLLHYVRANILSLDDDNITISSIGEYKTKKYMKLDENSSRYMIIRWSTITLFIDI